MQYILSESDQALLMEQIRNKPTDVKRRGDIIAGSDIQWIYVPLPEYYPPRLFDYRNHLSYQVGWIVTPKSPDNPSPTTLYEQSASLWYYRGSPQVFVRSQHNEPLPGGRVYLCIRSPIPNVIPSDTPDLTYTIPEQHLFISLERGPRPTLAAKISLGQTGVYNFTMGPSGSAGQTNNRSNRPDLVYTDGNTLYFQCPAENYAAAYSLDNQEVPTIGEQVNYGHKWLVTVFIDQIIGAVRVQYGIAQDPYGICQSQWWADMGNDALDSIWYQQGLYNYEEWSYIPFAWSGIVTAPAGGVGFINILGKINGQPGGILNLGTSRVNSLAYTNSVDPDINIPPYKPGNYPKWIPGTDATIGYLAFSPTPPPSIGINAIGQPHPLPSGNSTGVVHAVLVSDYVGPV